MGAAEGQGSKVVFVGPWGISCPQAVPHTLTHHAWVLGLERYKLPQGGHVGWLVGGHWRRGGVQDVMVAGDDGGERLVGDGELLHGACLDQLWGREKNGGQTPTVGMAAPLPPPQVSNRPHDPRNLHSSGLGYPHDLRAPTAQVVPRGRPLL